ncbi:Membrane protein oxaA [Spirochaeta thermophila DSM 6578]|uniref:Membrane protein insertase YidC n=1 Tax=Winmispira thermophila (strain ATCC 700085 / DSM 6578 / Z-1203) TaxID=869211 RepID=G0GAZ3_WINT7|nr:membrane protein insertase YidC [Spirochaeta thermophila]AEJ60295.1 Membrane protein oxaA [Spirochaeta thermophila DSM 6578]
MERNVVIAVILSAVVIIASAVINQMLFMSQVPQVPTPVEEEVLSETPTPQATSSQEGSSLLSEGLPSGLSVEALLPAEDREVVYRSPLMEVVFSSRGGTVRSLKLLTHRDGEESVEMVYRPEGGRNAFSLSIGKGDLLLHVPFQVRRPDERTVEFFQDVRLGGLPPFRVTKRYRFYPGEYLFDLEVELVNSENSSLPLNFEGVMYTLDTGPQIGPPFAALDRYGEYRKFFYFLNGKRKEVRLDPGKISELEEGDPTWVAISGKYFTLIAIPLLPQYDVAFSTVAEGDLPLGSTVYLYRPAARSARITDLYRFYVGPKISGELSKYNKKNENSAGLSELHLEKVVDTSLLGWLEGILKFFLQIFFRLIPNYGVAIILLTLFVKILLFPLTHKSYESASKMQQLAPKMEEVRNRYKDDPQRMNQELALLYQKEGVNPLGGCLPLLLQIPIFFAMYGLFSSHFDLRGATFIPGWIDDLSVPESVFHFDTPLPLLGWTDIRLLPLILVVTQIISTKITQGASSSSQNQLFMYVLPVVFLFILYNAPAGLLVYWVAMNIFTIAQQLYINRVMKRKTSD